MTASLVVLLAAWLLALGWTLRQYLHRPWAQQAHRDFTCSIAPSDVDARVRALAASRRGWRTLTTRDHRVLVRTGRLFFTPVREVTVERRRADDGTRVSVRVESPTSVDWGGAGKAVALIESTLRTPDDH